MTPVSFMCSDDNSTQCLHYKLSVLHNLPSSGAVPAEFREITQKEETKTLGNIQA